MRVIHSTIQSAHIDDDHEDAYAEAVAEALSRGDQVRETYSLDGIGQEESGIAVLPCKDPAGGRRWVLAYTDPGTVDWQDTDDLDEAIALYEETVRETTEGALPVCDEEGNELPQWDKTDVEGVSAREVTSGADGNAAARMIDAQWAHEAFTADEERYQQSARRRQIAFARMVDSSGRGGQARLAARTDLSEPTVKRIVETGRKVLAAQETPR